MSSELFVGPDSQPDRYRLVRSVRSGDEATLHLAEVRLAGQTDPVVVKVLDSDVVDNDEQFAELGRRWNDQAELLRFINRLGVVGVREHFEGAPEHCQDTAGEYTDRALYLVMNYVDGVDLRDWRAEHAVAGATRQREVLRYLEQVAEVLDLLHAGRATPSKRVVVHGDLSPGNIMISHEGQATLVDFGLSKIATRHLPAKPWFTPGYAAPEIVNGEYTAATDRYAFGAIVYHALTGEEPPPVPEPLRERFAALPLLADASQQQRARTLEMFSVEPDERPATLAWIRTLRSLSTSVPWSAPTSEVGVGSGAVDGVATGAALSGTGHALKQGGDAPTKGSRPAPSGAPPEPPGAVEPGAQPGSSSPPGAVETDAQASPLSGAGGRPVAAPPTGPRIAALTPGPPTTAAAGQPPAAAESRRPVGGMRGTPTAPGGRPKTAPSGPPTGSQPPATVAASGAPVPPDDDAPKKKSRTPLLLGLAAFGVCCMAAGSGLTYVAMDRFAIFNDDAAENAADSSPSPQATEEDEASDASEETPPEDRQPDELSLAAEEAVNTDYDSELATVNAVEYDEALTSSTCGDAVASYNLGRDYTEFTTTVGLDDESPSEGGATFTVLGDGEQLETITLELGEDTDLATDVTDILRLELSADNACDESVAVWAEPVVTR